MLRMMDGLASPKMPPLMKMSRLCTPWLYVIGGEARSIASEVGISFWASYVSQRFLQDGCREC